VLCIAALRFLGSCAAQEPPPAGTPPSQNAPAGTPPAAPPVDFPASDIPAPPAAPVPNTQPPAASLPDEVSPPVEQPAAGMPAPAPPQNIPARPAASSAAIPIERQPYRIRCWIDVDFSARIDPFSRERLITTWLAFNEGYVGPPWNVSLASGPGPLAGTALHELTPDTLAPLAQDVDKLWLIRVSTGPRGDYLISGREYDTATGVLGLISNESVPVLADAPRALFLLVRQLFSPLAEIGASANGGVQITIKGAAIPPANVAGQLVEPGSVFRPVRIYYNPDGSLLKPELVRRSYLTVEAVEAGIARCSITSALRDPLTRLVAGRARLVALGLKPSAEPTRFQFVTGQRQDLRPAAGFGVTVRPVGTPVNLERQVTTTDREGRVVLPPRIAPGLMLVRVVGGGLEPLADFPAMPGESAEEQMIQIDPKPLTLALESQLMAMRDEILDLIASRSRLEALLKARADGEAWPEVGALLEQYKPLLVRAQYEERLAKLDEDARTREQQLNRPIRTRTAQNLVTDTRALIERYLDEETFKAYDDAYQRWQAQAGQTAVAAAKAAPPPPPARGASAPAATVSAPAQPAVAPAPPPASAPIAGQGPPEPTYRFTSPDGSWTALLPAPPQPVADQPPPNASSIQSVRYFLFEHGSYTLSDLALAQPLTAANLKPALDATRDWLAQRLGGSRIVDEKPITQAGREGREFLLEVPAATPGGLETALRARCLAVDSHLLIAMYAGPKAWVSLKGASDFLASLTPLASPAAAPSPESAKAPASQPPGFPSPTPAPTPTPPPVQPATKPAEKSKSGSVVPF
jgi:hypothetical protein